MFCYKCGEKLVNEAAFCHACGSKMQLLDNDERSKKISINEITESHEIKFNLFGRTISFHKNIKPYIELRNMYELKAIDIAESFIKNIDSRYYDLDGFIKKSPKDIDSIYLKIIEGITSDLNSKGIFSINENHILEITSQIVGNWNILFNEIQKKHQELVGYQAEMIKYRTMKKNSRGRVIGGGFGLSGAVKGMATAGAINLTTGVVSSFFNSIGNANTASDVSSRKKAIFRNKEIRQNLKTAIYNDVLLMHYVHIDALNRFANISLPHFSIEMIDRAEVIYQNIISNRIPKNALEDAFIELFKNNPFQNKYYYLALTHLHYPLSEYSEITQLFSIDLEEKYKYAKTLSFLSYHAIQKNRIFNEMSDILKFDTHENIAFINTQFGEDYRLHYNCATNDHFHKKISNAEKSYGPFPNETPLVLYDSTAWGSGKSGFVITDKNVYIKEWSERHVIPIDELIETNIYYGENDVSYLQFKDKKVLLYQTELVQSGYLTEIINFILLMINFHNYNLYLPNNFLVNTMLKWCELNDMEEISQYLNESTGHCNQKKQLTLNKSQTLENDKTSKDELLMKENTPLDIAKEIERIYLMPFIKKSSENPYISSFPSINKEKAVALKTTIKMYPSIDLKNEVPLFYYDDGIINTGKSGFLLTNKTLYYHGKNGNGQYNLDDIKLLEYKMRKLLPSLLINSKIVIPCKLMGHDATKDFADTFYHIRSYLKEQNK